MNSSTDSRTFSRIVLLVLVLFGVGGAALDYIRNFDWVSEHRPGVEQPAEGSAELAASGITSQQQVAGVRKQTPPETTVLKSSEVVKNQMADAIDSEAPSDEGVSSEGAAKTKNAGADIASVSGDTSDTVPANSEAFGDKPVLAPMDDTQQTPDMATAANGSTRLVRGFAFQDVQYKDDGNGKRLMLSGTAAPGQRVRLFAGEERIGEVVADNVGTWSFAKSGPVKHGIHLFRAAPVLQNGRAGASARLQYDHIKPAEVTRSSPATRQTTPDKKRAEGKTGAPAEPKRKTGTASRKLKSQQKNGGWRPPKSRYFVGRSTRNKYHAKRSRRLRVYPKNYRLPAGVTVVKGPAFWEFNLTSYSRGYQREDGRVEVRYVPPGQKGSAKRLRAGISLTVPRLFHRHKRRRHHRHR